VEIGAPVYSRKNGLQPETDLMASIGWQYAF
jgi:hypothetical protein